MQHLDKPIEPLVALGRGRLVPTDTELLDHMEQTRRYPFPNVGKWTMRVGPDKQGGTWVHGGTARECLQRAVEASR